MPYDGLHFRHNRNVALCLDRPAHEILRFYFFSSLSRISALPNRSDDLSESKRNMRVVR